MMDVDELAAGLELDALVAERMFGRQPEFNTVGWDDDGGPLYAFCRCPDGDHEDAIACVPGLLKRYSTDIDAAWDIVRHLQERCIHLVLSNSEGKWVAILWAPSRSEAHTDKEYHTMHYAKADTAALAICRAALKL